MRKGLSVERRLRRTGKGFCQGEEDIGGVFFMWQERVFDVVFIEIPAVIANFEQEECYFGEGWVV